MAPRGPKTKPTQLKVLSGTARKHRLNPAEPRPDPVIPEAPGHLTGAARAEWDRLVGEMAALGMLTRLDRSALAACCQAYWRWVAAEQALARMAEKDPVTEGLMIRTSQGNVIQNPLVGAANKAMADLVRYAAEFGLTPSSRSRVVALDKAPSDDPFAIFDAG